MEERAITLGQALAYLRIEQDAGQFRDWQLPAEAQRYLQRLRERLLAADHRDRLHKLLQALPECGCGSDKPGLADNEDFFLASIVMPRATEGRSEDCGRLMKHLNDCYWCFEEFCQVLRDYNRRLQELSQTA